jgi:uncharacterized protein YqeY
MLRDAISDAYKTAMRARDQAQVSTLRMVMSGLKDRDIAARPKGVDQIADDEILSMLQTMVKQRRESIELYRQGGRTDLVDNELAEIAVIERFLPQQMDEAAMAAAIDRVVSEIGAASIKDMGRVMAELKQRFVGQMDFGKAGQLVKTRLG